MPRNADAEKRFELYRTFFDMSDDLYVIVDHHMVIQKVNRAWEDILGFGEDDLIDQPISRFIHPDDANASIAATLRTYEGRPLYHHTNRYFTKSGEERWISWRANVFDGYVYAMGKDITAERTATLKLEDANRLLSNSLKLEREWRAMAEVQQQRFRDLFNQVPMIATVYSGADHTIELANPSFYQLVNFRNVMGCAIDEALPMLDEVTRQTLAQVYLTGKRFVGRNVGMKADWTATGVPTEKLFHLIFEPIIDKAGTVEAIWCLAFDVSETVELETKLRSAERMSSLGEMAAGIGHEINNPLAYSLLNLDLLTDKLGVQFGSREEIPGPMRDLLRKSIDGLDRVRDIVKGLKSFSRQDESVLEPIDVSEPLESALAFTANETRHRARVVTELGSSLPRVLANSGRLAQVFTNLLVNASHALDIGRAHENTITVRSFVDAQDRVVVDIEDSGCGIPPENLNRVFEPFFTSKPVGVGTGLGLSICHGIIASFGGDIEIASEVGKGTRVRILLPATQEEIRLSETSEAAPCTAGRKRILVIDDDRSLRDVIQTALSTDHDVIAMESAIEALQHLDDVRECYDWVICDVMMPAMTGMEFFETIRARGTGFEKKIILMTGGAFTPKVRSWMETLSNPKLEKPFRMKQLKELLARQA